MISLLSDAWKKNKPLVQQGRPLYLQGSWSLINHLSRQKLLVDFVERSFLHCLFAGETKRKQEGGGGGMEEWGSETLTISDWFQENPKERLIKEDVMCSS